MLQQFLSDFVKIFDTFTNVKKGSNEKNTIVVEVNTKDVARRVARNDPKIAKQLGH